MFRPRLTILAALVLALSLAPSTVRAAADVRRLNLAISAIPTQVKAGDFNDVVQFYNNNVLEPSGFAPLDEVSFAWMFDGELRYMVMRNLSINAGVGHLKTSTSREYLPALATSINVSADLITVPVHVGVTYYLQPYNQGDFQARMLFGGGIVQYTNSRTVLTQSVESPDPNLAGGSFQLAGTQDAPGYYVEGGVHMFFAARYSILLSAQYRSGEIANFYDEDNPPGAILNPYSGEPFKLDVSGVGLRMSAVIGF